MERREFLGVLGAAPLAPGFALAKSDSEVIGLMGRVRLMDIVAHGEKQALINSLPVLAHCPDDWVVYKSGDLASFDYFYRIFEKPIPDIEQPFRYWKNLTIELNGANYLGLTKDQAMKIYSHSLARQQQFTIIK